MFGLALFNVYLASLLWQYSSIHNFFRSKRVILSLTLKERAIHIYIWLVCCWQYPSIDNLFRSKRVMLSLTLKERGIHVYLACLLWQYPSIDHSFRSKRVILSLTLKERAIHIYLASLLLAVRIRRFIISFALNGSYCRSRLKNELHVYLASLLLQYPSIDNFFRSKRVMLSLTLKERGIHV